MKYDQSIRRQTLHQRLTIKKLLTESIEWSKLAGISPSCHACLRKFYNLEPERRDLPAE